MTLTSWHFSRFFFFQWERTVWLTCNENTLQYCSQNMNPWAKAKKVTDQLIVTRHDRMMNVVTTHTHHQKKTSKYWTSISVEGGRKKILSDALIPWFIPRGDDDDDIVIITHQLFLISILRRSMCHMALLHLTHISAPQMVSFSAEKAWCRA